MNILAEWVKGTSNAGGEGAEHRQKQNIAICVKITG